MKKKKGMIASWKTMELPQYIEEAGLKIDGVIWFRKDFNVPQRFLGKPAKVSLGPIDDSDVVYINGEEVGKMEQSHDKDRIYDIPANLLVGGKNVIAVRVEDTGGGGGIYGKKEQMYIQSEQGSIPLSGFWKYEVEEDFSSKSKDIFKGTSIAEFFMQNYYSEEGLVQDGISKKTGNVKTIRIGTIKNEMKFDLSEFVVEAGESVELIFENTDFMQHNLVITGIEAKEKVGMAADELAVDPEGQEKKLCSRNTRSTFCNRNCRPSERGRPTF